MSIRQLQGDFLLYLAKYLSAKDRFSLAMSGVNRRFTLLYGHNRTRLVISECYFPCNWSWRRFFKYIITSSSITVCDMSHCYWLKAKVLKCNCITKMQNLEELYIQDTRVSLKKMPQIFEACQKIVKLSLTVKKNNLDEFKEGVMENSSLKWMKKGFRKITHLKLFIFVFPSCTVTNSKPWLASMGVLKWCWDCTDLLINITYKNNSTYFIIYPEEQSTEREKAALLKELKPYFYWIKALKSLVILGGHSDVVYDYFIKDFILISDWMVIESLERLWITPYVDYEVLQRCGRIGLLTNTVKSAMSDSYLWDNLSDSNEARFRQLEHLSNVYFYQVDHGLDHLPNLKYISGECHYDTKGLNDFCKYHPNLVQLHFFLENNVPAAKQHLFELSDWKLLLLKVLVYSCCRPSQSVMDHLTEACSNIQQYHIEFSESRSRTETINFLSSIRFKNLTWLTISGASLYDGSYLLQIVKQCPKLERLHLKGEIEGNSFFINLSKCFPFATHLRDLRVQCWSNVQMVLYRMPSFFKYLKLCKHLERFVLCTKNDDWERDCSSMQYTITYFVERMPHLVALCLTGFPIDQSKFEDQFMAEIVPNRPALWFNFGSELPKASDLSIPRIHYDGIVNPINPYYSPPRF